MYPLRQLAIVIFIKQNIYHLHSLSRVFVIVCAISSADFFCPAAAIAENKHTTSDAPATISDIEYLA